MAAMMPVLAAAEHASANSSHGDVAMSLRGTNAGRYDYGIRLGSGAYGEVYLARDTHCNMKQVAIKFITSKNVDAAFRVAQEEAKILESLGHANVIRFQQVFSYRNAAATAYNVCIVSEFCERGDLNKYLIDNSTADENKVPARLQTMLMLQSIAGLEYLHANDVTHRDIKPGNILLDRHLNVKIADFGLSKKHWGRQKGSAGQLALHTVCGTDIFMAPEVATGHYTNAVDVLSLGLVFLCIILPYRFSIGSIIIPYVDRPSRCTLEMAFNKDSSVTAIKHFGMEIESSLTLYQQKILAAMLEFQPHRRATASNIRQMLKTELLK